MSMLKVMLSKFIQKKFHVSLGRCFLPIRKESIGSSLGWYILTAKITVGFFLAC
ncbi:hypothetical protein AI2644V1_1261 [Klebsiella pneumoniae]|nr:hypothetical protein AI2644V1_1261 [Klebsiella pneumoniae]CAE6227389.1 hypothetical protein AI2647V1_1261 [Klebsiella pneumoniae]CAE6227503.1 hypothetical protein AI2648V1_1261 [Klebsiella pneumoniae]CAE6227728.1 hypothetical protein AI2653V1_1262 [Klebsiella pneumoniae]CAE6227976.1 hypothetical protein AI2646V1_1261 [Klebsiella pneumoniae]